MLTSVKKRPGSVGASLGVGVPAVLDRRSTRTPVGVCGRDEGSSAGAEPRKLPQEVKSSKGCDDARVPIPIPARCRDVGNGNWERDFRSAVGETVAAVQFDGAAGGSEHADALMERGGPDAALGPQLGERDRLIGLGEEAQDAIIERAWRRRHGLAPI